jgi:hypothetical protein
LARTVRNIAISPPPAIDIIFDSSGRPMVDC